MMNPEFLQRVADAFTLAPGHDTDIRPLYVALILLSLLIGIISALVLWMESGEKPSRARRKTRLICSALILASIAGVATGAGQVITVVTQRDTDDPRNRAGGVQSIALSQELDAAMIQRLHEKYDIERITLYDEPNVRQNENGTCTEVERAETVPCPTGADAYQPDGDPRLSAVLLEEIGDSGRLPEHDISRKVNVTVNDEDRTVWILEYQAATHDVVLHNNPAANATITPDQHRKKEVVSR